jgi:hypothetical protein
MSYTNPQQFVPQQYAQQNQRLQDTINMLNSKKNYELKMKESPRKIKLLKVE